MKINFYLFVHLQPCFRPQRARFRGGRGARPWDHTEHPGRGELIVRDDDVTDLERAFRDVHHGAELLGFRPCAAYRAGLGSRVVGWSTRLRARRRWRHGRDGASDVREVYAARAPAVDARVFRRGERGLPRVPDRRRVRRLGRGLTGASIIGRASVVAFRPRRPPAVAPR